MGVVALRRYIDILTIIINFPYSTCISSFFGSSIPTSLFIFKMFFSVFIGYIAVYLLLNKSFLPKSKVISFLCIVVNSLVPIL